jgi:hypothetical protein
MDLHDPDNATSQQEREEEEEAGFVPYPPQALSPARGSGRRCVLHADIFSSTVQAQFQTVLLVDRR